MTTTKFQQLIFSWYNKNQRSFPWRETQNPYHIMVSEFMLQQTQTQRVVPKYQAFIDQFPNVTTLSHANLAEVLRLWQGLGYNRRAKYLYQSAKQIQADFNGIFPKSADELLKLPGIGPYTSKAIVTFAYNQPLVFIETNIRTVYLHFFFADEKEVDDNDILEKVEITLDTNNPRDWYYALMDYGVYLKQTIGNLNVRSQHYSKQSKFKGSDRQVRGWILKQTLTKGKLTLEEIKTKFNYDSDRLQNITQGLINEKLVVQDDQGHYQISNND